LISIAPKKHTNHNLKATKPIAARLTQIRRYTTALSLFYPNREFTIYLNLDNVNNVKDHHSQRLKMIEVLIPPKAKLLLIT